MLKSPLLAATALLALSAPALAQRSMPTPVAPDPRIAALRDKALSDDTAYAIVESVTTEVGPRPDGSAAEERARTWAVAKMKALGFQNVRVEPFTLPIWQRGIETAEIVAPFPQPLRLTALGNSGATPPEGVTLPVAYFASFNDLLLAPAGSLAGKIAFVSNAMQPTQDGSSYGSQGMARFVGPNIAASKGAAAIIIRSIGTDHGRGPHAGNTNFAPGVTPIPAAALSVADAENLERIVKLGKPVMLHLTLTPKQLGEGPSGNVVGELPGTDPAAGVVLVGGHLDSWDLGTGAIDDGAGIAITAAAARLVHADGKHRRTIRVVWFGDEETGGFGGIAYAKAHAGERHALAAESDFGADRVWRFNVNLPDSAKAVGDRLAVALAPLGIVRGTAVAGDGTDVEPTLKTGVAAIDLNQSGLRYFDWHHTPEDTLDRIDPAQLAQNVAAWTAMLAIVANAPEEIGTVTPKQ
ncbi:M20/M25/M40 family metallo-hydrolase [Sphingomonas sp. AR_OL41]|uniref:M20/M25/M40 family metallo-hydrolase n=1 Tax=Sphingomonas sp. AR_OL41 TaxID=3042729 RepID=UPI00247FC4E9|nr:M20/M25/M40 family metallo-hydrolase [Sphingomonas sp. AR_OL41]MDH7974119.1 M20/M25/M40 family metallo-hydrolase [Sphingomonas sp. AR_OL41]